MRIPGPPAGRFNQMLLFGLLLFSAALFPCPLLKAQKRYNVWAVGDSLGLNFNKTPVTFIPTASPALVPDVRMTAICDTFGDLLFYSDGITLWDKRNKPVPKQGTRWPFAGKIIPLAVAHPGFDSAYYLLGVSSEGQDQALVAIPVALENNRPVLKYPPGSTLPAATFLLRNAGMALAATTHCNGRDTWIVGYSQGAFHSFLLTPEGIQAAAVVSPVPMAPVLNTGYTNAKFAASGEVLVVPSVGENAAQLFDFNNATGRFSFRMKVPTPDTYQLQEAELSPDGRKLYTAVGRVEQDPEDEDVTINRHYIHQYNLDAGDEAAILASRSPMNGAEGQKTACGERRSCAVINRTLQLGPDGRIYANQKLGSLDPYEKRAFVIEHPNRTGKEAGFRLSALENKRKYKYINFNYIRSGSFSLRQNGIQVQAQTCRDQPAAFSLLFSRIDSVRWNFGDPASGSANFSRDLRPSHRYPGPGRYTVKAIIFKNCYTDTAIREIEVEDIPAIKIPAGLKDTTFCVGQALFLDATTPTATTYAWDNGLIYPKREIKESGTYEVKVANSCSEDSRSVAVKIEACTCKAFVPNAFTPDGDGRNDLFKPSLDCFAKDYEFVVYHRYGGTAFRSTAVGQGWTGSSGTALLPTGVYVWTLRYRNPNTGKELFQQGTVMLIR